MNAVLNHAVVPFFDRVPPRGKAAVLATFDNIVDKAWTLKEAFTQFNNTLRSKDIEGPTHAEFEDWYARVKNGLIERPHFSEAIVAAAVDSRKTRPSVVKQPMGVGLAVDNTASDLDGLKHARAIVEAADRLFEAKLAAGYSPLSLMTEDTIVAEALRQLLEADGPGFFSNSLSNAIDAAHAILIDRATDEQLHHLLDVLTMDMQPALCRSLARRPPPAAD
ncbi:hypothetical protein [Agrobacterium sp. SORGH_AS 787]|uniref:hypothetical protein n=1 Tax=Agrobacterium sp. SORGH_AS 787 TaxID=3041775 RepID=UPI00277E67D3|nr:hypothetical protein [Rhizobium sp. SORGH_AS_0787]